MADARVSRSVVITGATAGVGRAAALRFARNGDRVCVIGRAQSGVEAAVRELAAAGAEAFGIAGDVAEWATLFKAADDVTTRWGGIDVWVNNAMVTMFAPVSKMTCEEYERITSVTYLGYVYGTMAALKPMTAQNRGVIVQVGSALAYRAIPLQSAYCGAKFAVRAFTDALRSELLRDRSEVRLTMLQLPAVNTPQFDWARNRMGFKPRPVPPVFQPEAIAEIVFKAAGEAPREVWIGWPTLKLIAGAVATPAYLDRYFAKAGYEGQLTASLEQDAAGNLFAAKADEHAVRGRFSVEAKPSPRAFNPMLLRAGVALTAAAMGLFLFALGGAML